MNLLFVHDTKIKEDEKGNYYTTGSYNEKVWLRYLKYSKGMKIIVRKEEKTYTVKEAQNNFNIIPKDKVSTVIVPNITKSLLKYLSFNNRKKIKDIIEQEVIDADLIIIRLPSRNGIEAIKQAKKYNKPYLIEVVGCVWDSMWNYGFKGKILAPKEFFVQKKLVKKAPYVLYVTNEFLQKRYPTLGESIGCSDVNINEVEEETIEKRINKLNSFSTKKELNIGTIAAVDVKYKGQDIIIKSLPQLKKKNYKIKYHLIGGGETFYLEHLARKLGVEDMVIFHGSVSHDKIFPLLDFMDIYIQPSKLEGLPRALVEALSRGCPAIGSNVGGIPELLNSNMIFKKGSVDSFIDCFSRLTKDTLIKESQTNFNMAKKYEKNLLDFKRDNFLRMFWGENGFEDY